MGCKNGGRPTAADSSGTPPPGSFTTATGTCGSEGAVRECHVRLGDANGVVDCFEGKQECRNGQWSVCGGGDITLSSVDRNASLGTPSDVAGGVKTLASPSSTTGVCTTDPCDAYCSAFNEDAGLQAEAGAGSSYTISGNEWGNAPGGFIGKQDCSSPGCAASTFAAGGHDCNGAPSHYNTFDACQADHHCDTSSVSTGTCVRNTSPSNWTWPSATCAGVDLTLGPACKPTAASQEQFTICNRGNTALASGTAIPIYLDTGNSYVFSSGAACYNKAPSCTKTLAAALNPGSCVAVTEADCPAWGNGNQIAYVNSNQSVTECTSTSAAGTAATKPGCNNNWSDVKKGGNICGTASGGYGSRTVTQSYTATCQTGSAPTWKYLTYNATIACSPGACNGTNNSTITFKGQLTDISPTGVVGSPTPATPSTITTVTSTKNCAVSGPTGCPINIATWAGGAPKSNYEILTLTIELAPSTDTLASPTLSSWAVSYDCVPNE